MDPDLDVLPIPFPKFPDPGVKKAQDSGSALFINTVQRVLRSIPHEKKTWDQEKLVQMRKVE
jgi:hypothetical protein